MALLKILQYPDKRLRIIAKPVKIINQKIQKIVDNMFETMLHEDGIGLAATQVDIPLQIIVISKIKTTYNPLVLINPKIIDQHGVTNIEEGCLSLPQHRAIIPRYKHITIQSLNYFGQSIEIKAHDILSICIQHEIDHLIGKLFIDHLSPLKKKLLKKK
ncbi:MAG TPA: peptide deformylase [Buchnera sp. (in: enterobacteria)]|nr:peptide deformylase [Buchnera sp. (in: enterobacteria)]